MRRGERKVEKMIALRVKRKDERELVNEMKK